MLHADEHGKQLREELLKKVKLSNLEKRNFKDVQEIVFKMAKKLIAIHSKRRKTYRRGQIDIRKTLRNNMQYDGNLFDLRWKSSKVDRPKVMCICDCSGSVSNYSRFLLMFLYSLAEIIPKVRSFAFSSDLGEVTDIFQRSSLEDAMAKRCATTAMVRPTMGKCSWTSNAAAWMTSTIKRPSLSWAMRATTMATRRAKFFGKCTKSRSA